MILAGIDEAGLGPLLGPLCVCGHAVRLDGVALREDADPPDVWAALADAVSRKRDRRGHKLHVADSKKVTAGRSDAGLASLERGALAIAAAGGISISDGLDAFAGSLNVRPPASWYGRAEDERFPADVSRDGVMIAANALRHAATKAGASVLSPVARVLFEAEFNRLCDATRNKASVVQTAMSAVLDRLIRDHGGAEGGLFVVIDRQGGRSRYGPFLMQGWPGWELAVLAEDEGRSDYLLCRGGDRVRLLFAERGEELALPTAAASMLAKYLRERLMARFNAYFCEADPTLKPTAGYWTDAQRWLEDANEALGARGVSRDDLVRNR